MLTAIILHIITRSRFEMKARLMKEVFVN